MSPRNRPRRGLTGQELGRQHAAELPGREAMSLLGGGLATGGALPELSPDGGDADGAIATADAYDDAGRTAADQQLASARQSAIEGDAGGENVPNGTATSSAS